MWFRPGGNMLTMKRKQHMLERFRLWYLANTTELTWFVIGAMVMSGLIYFGQAQYVNAVLCWAIAGANWYFNRK
jgi:hypothetical protein